MGENSKIEWTTHTFNPWWGCTKVAAGCTHCYAESFSKRTGRAKWGENGTRQITSPANWRDPIKWNKAAEEAGERHRVFCASMSDVFEDWSGPVMSFGRQPIYLNRQLRASSGEADRATLDDVRHRLFELIDATPNLDWLLLTKRPENIRRMWCGLLEDFGTGKATSFRKNVWLGTSIATQADADRNIPLLLECRDLAPVLFLSCEPLVEAVDLSHCTTKPSAWLKDCRETGAEYAQSAKRARAGVENVNVDICSDMSDRWLDSYLSEKRKMIDWVIVGGESGHGARPMHPDWVRAIRDQCQTAGVPLFFKQWGEWAPWYPDDVHGCFCSPDRAMNHVWEDRSFSLKVGKKAAGRLLDGIGHNEFPAAIAT